MFRPPLRRKVDNIIIEPHVDLVPFCAVASTTHRVLRDVALRSQAGAGRRTAWYGVYK